MKFDSKRIAHEMELSSIREPIARAIQSEATSDSDQEAATRHGVSKATIGQIRRGDTWREFGGMFTSLMQVGAR